MSFEPKFPLKLVEVGGDGLITCLTKISNETSNLHGTVLSGLFSPSTGHKHTGAVNDGPKIGTNGIADEAITFNKLALDAVTFPTMTKGVPVGFIGMWAGSVASIADINIDYGIWKLCDGTNGTINLRDRFIIGAGNSYVVGASGGSATHTLTIDEIPGHTHQIALGGNGEDESVKIPSNSDGLRGETYTTSSIGGGLPHNNLPPYYALCYIQRIS